MTDLKKNIDVDALKILHDMHHDAFSARNLSSQAARELGIRIMRETYPSGTVLPEEGKLADELRVSRTVIREAVKILTAKGLVEVRPRLGSRVLPKRYWQILDREMLAWQQALTFSRNRLMQLMEMRRVIEPAAARLAAERRTEDDLERMRQAFSEMEQEVETPDEYVNADARFHSAVLKSCHNEYFDALEALVFVGLLASIRITNPQVEANTTSLPLHRDVLLAIADRKSTAAADAMALLLEDAESRLSAALRGRRAAEDLEEMETPPP